MRVFLDFEASSLSEDSYPIEVAWIFEDGRSESHLIRPHPDWTDWRAISEGIHGIDRQRLFAEGVAYDVVARRMVAELSGHALFASAPTWDGKWLNVLLQAAGLPSHAMLLRSTSDAQAETIVDVLSGHIPDSDVANVIRRIKSALSLIEWPAPAHRALEDAERELARWQAAKELALAERNTHPSARSAL